MLQIFKSVLVRRSRRLVGVSCATVALAVSIACGMGMPGLDDIVLVGPTPVLHLGGEATVPVGVQVAVPITTTEGGSFRASVYHSENALGNFEVALGRGPDPCTFEQVASDTCQTLLHRATRGEIGHIRWQVRWGGGSAGAYILYIANSGVAEETVGYQIYF